MGNFRMYIYICICTVYVYIYTYHSVHIQIHVYIYKLVYWRVYNHCLSLHMSEAINQFCLAEI
jgi:hypothetical protein